MKSLGLSWKPAAKGATPIIVASNRPIPRIGVCEGIRITMASIHQDTPLREHCADLEIMELTDASTPLILGCPTLALFGIGLQGVPFQFPQRVSKESVELPENLKDLSIQEPMFMDIPIAEINDFFEDDNKDKSLYSSYLSCFQRILSSHLAPLLN